MGAVVSLFLCAVFAMEFLTRHVPDRWVVWVPIFGIGESLAAFPLPHLRAYGSHTRRFDENNSYRVQ